jgi:hypothetical protein
MIFRAGFALDTVGSFVNGLMPLRALLSRDGHGHAGQTRTNEGRRYDQGFIDDLCFHADLCGISVRSGWHAAR